MSSLLLLFFPLLLFSLVSAASAFLAPTSFVKVHHRAFSSHAFEAADSRLCSAATQTLIVGKIILDKYGPPDRQTDDDGVTIGGGGPQSAWGAAASLVVRDYLSRNERKKINNDDERDFLLSNPKHQITFLAPVGTKNWTPSMTEQLSQLLPPMVNVVLVPS
mmetsp:Transcript_11374/g.22754  ORF Transcript_11374/g.22754 Transcript_11374/m.22754 type:complete len:162 (+) Transcript_11374:123-608(+)